MKKIVFLIGFLGFGGSERQLYLLLRHLDPNRFQCHVVVFNPSPNLTYDDALRQAGVQVWNVPPAAKGIHHRVRYLHRLLRSLAPDIVHSWTFHDNAYAGIAGRLAGVPVRWGSLRNSWSAVEVQKLPALYRRLSLWSAGRILVNAKALAEELVAAGYPRRRILVLPNCIECPDAAVRPQPCEGSEPWQGLTRSLSDLSVFGLNEEQSLIGIVGNLRYQKNHLLYVEAMAQLLPHYPQARGLIIGQPVPLNPGVAEAIEAAIARHGLDDKIIMTGFRADVADLMGRLDILALTSHYEGMPNVVMEAMAAGRPVVATRVGGVPDLVEDGVTGYVVPPGDAATFAQAVHRLLDNPAQARQMGQAGRQRIQEQFNCRQIAGRLADLYQQVTTHPPGGFEPPGG